MQGSKDRDLRSMVDEARDVAGHAELHQYAPAVPANWPVPPTEVAQALDELAANAVQAGVTPVLVYRPAGVAAGNVFTSWTALMAERAKLHGPWFLQVESPGVTAPVPAGAWDLDSVTISSNGYPTTLEFENGATISFNTLSATAGVVLQANSAAPIWSAATTTTTLVRIDDLAVIQSVTAVPFFQNNTATLEIIVADQGGLGDGVNPVVENNNAGAFSIVIVVGDSVVSPNALMNNAVGAQQVASSSDSRVFTPQGASWTIILQSNASREHYTPAVPGNWPTPPTQVAQALDELAADAIQAGFTPVLVYRPAGVAGGNVFTSWPALMTERAKLNGPWFLQVEPGVLPVASVPAGAWNLDSATISSNGFSSILEFENGATATFTNLRVTAGVVLQANSAAAIWTTGAVGKTTTVSVDNLGAIQSITAVPFFSNTTVGQILEIIVSQQGVLGDAAHPVVQVAGPTGLVFAVGSSTINANALMNGGGVNQVAVSSDSQIFAPQGASWVELMSSQSNSTAYVPSNLANWSALSPGNVANALDRIAAKITPIP